MCRPAQTVRTQLPPYLRLLQLVPLRFAGCSLVPTGRGSWSGMKASSRATESSLLRWEWPIETALHRLGWEAGFVPGSASQSPLLKNPGDSSWRPRQDLNLRPSL